MAFFLFLLNFTSKPVFFFKMTLRFLLLRIQADLITLLRSNLWNSGAIKLPASIRGCKPYDVVSSCGPITLQSKTVWKIFSTVNSKKVYKKELNAIYERTIDIVSKESLLVWQYVLKNAYLLQKIRWKFFGHLTSRVLINICFSKFM